ncbi:MAG: hypothetical protein GX087_03985 [Desulfobulbaceae bacterium]|nr:hypothetical protein [Desulfobulbaceae bacterium]
MTRTLVEIPAPGREDCVPSPDSRAFFPAPPVTLADTGLNSLFLEELACKLLLQHGMLSGKELAERLCLPFKLVENLLYELKQQLIVTYHGTTGLSDFIYILSEKGQRKALLAREQSAYTGPAPVPYSAYVESVRLQALTLEKPDLATLRQALTGLVLPEKLLMQLGCALHSGQAIFLYGEPGNGKTETALRLARCFREHIFLPQALLIEGQVVQLYDRQSHVPVDGETEQPRHDQRWLLIQRPMVTVGGEMDMASLEIGYNQHTRVCEASLQMKGNCGIFIVDDFGRQKIGPEQVLNRWILPLEKGIDYLTLPNGTKFQTPFRSILLFCSNTSPAGLLDEAFLRRLPYKIHMANPDEAAFRVIMREEAAGCGLACPEEALEYLLARHFRGIRPLRGCYPRDFCRYILNQASFAGTEARISPATLDEAAALCWPPLAGEQGRCSA